jgi:hypothetical protein
MAKSSNKETLTPLSLSPQEHSKMKDNPTSSQRVGWTFSPLLLYIGPPEKTEVPLH